jgi:hypothetical protein
LSAAAFELSRSRSSTTAQALSCLTHAADAARKWSGISTLVATRLAIAVAGAVAAFAAARLAAAIGTTAHARDAARHREFNLWNAAYTTALAASGGAATRRRATTR